MHLILPPFQAEDGDGFGSDIFNRKPFAKSLTNLVRRTNDPLVISLNGHWGEGKTTFVKAWQAQLSEQYVPNIYVDAFAADHVEDAFMVVAGAITDYVDGKIPEDKTEAFLDKAKHVGANLLSIGAKVGIRAATAGLVHSDDFKDLDSALSSTGDDIAKSAEAYIKRKLSNHKKEIASVTQFKDFLSSLPKLLQPESDHSLTIIIDELDRCRPSFAVEMLEKIKHLFSVQNITFVLVINKVQLQESIKAMYGANIDAHTYLQKFLTIEAEMPRRAYGDESVCAIYCKYLSNAHGLAEQSDIATLMAALGEHLGLTLRQIEKMYSNYVVLVLSGGAPTYEAEGLYAALCALKVSHPSVFSRLGKSEISYLEVYKTIGYDENDDERHSHPLHYSLKWIRALLMPEAELAGLPHDSFYRTLLTRGMRGNRQNFMKKAVNRLTVFDVK